MPPTFIKRGFHFHYIYSKASWLSGKERKEKAFFTTIRKFLNIPQLKLENIFCFKSVHMQSNTIYPIHMKNKLDNDLSCLSLNPNEVFIFISQLHSTEKVFFFCLFAFYIFSIRIPNKKNLSLRVKTQWVDLH